MCLFLLYYKYAKHKQENGFLKQSWLNEIVTISAFMIAALLI